MTYVVISWLVPKTYSTTLDDSLDNSVTSLIADLAVLTPLESGKVFDEILLNNNGVLLQLFDVDNNEIELPSQDSRKFPIPVDSGMATESADPTAYRATHSYLFSFADTEDIYTLVVAGSAHEVNLLKDTLSNIFFTLFFIILLIAIAAAIVYSRYVTKPVLELSNVSKKMSELDFSWKCKEKRTDELGILVHSLNEMSQKLSATMEHLKNANVKLQADIEHKRELEQAQLDFFSAVSHELKTPITVIKGQTEGMILNVGDYQDRNKYLARSLEIINTLEGLNHVVKVGKARYIGISNCFAWQLAKANALSEKEGFPQFVSVQGHYNLIFREEEREMAKLCQEDNIAMTPYSALAGGRLSKHPGEISKRSQEDNYARLKYDATATQDKIIIDRVAELAEKHDVSMTEVSLAWLLNKVTSPVVGATKLHHVEGSVKAVELLLTDEELAYLEEPYIPHSLVGVMAQNTAMSAK